MDKSFNSFSISSEKRIYRFNFTELVRSPLSGSHTFDKLFTTLMNAFSVSLKGPPGNKSKRQSYKGYTTLELGSIKEYTEPAIRF